MRTSGAPTETSMTVAVSIVALGVLTLLAGGPDELLLTIERLLRAASEILYQAWLAVVG